MAYESKKALLIRLGKNPDDRNLINRMIGRWEVYEEWGMYYLVKEENWEELNSQNFSDAAKILELKWEIEKLKEERIVLIRERNHLEQELEKWMDGWEEVNQSDLDFQIAENERLEVKVAMYQEAIRRCYMWAVNVKKDKTPWPIFKKDVLKLEEDLPGEDNQ